MAETYRRLIWKAVRSSYVRQSMSYAMLLEGALVLTGTIQVWSLGYWLPREDYGVWGYCSSLAGLSALFTLPGLSQAVTFCAAHAEDGALWSATKIRLRFGILASISLWAMALFHFKIGRLQAGWLLLVMGVLTPAQQAFDTADAYLAGVGEFRTVFFRRIAIQAAMVGSVSTAAWASRSVVVCGIMLHGVGLALSALLFVMIYRRRRNDNNSPFFGAMIRRFSAQSAASTISRSTERPLLSAFVSFADLAAYNMATATLVPVGLGRIIDRILLNRLARKEGSVPVPEVIKASWLLFIIGWPVYVLSALGVYLAITIMLPRYIDSIGLASILLLQLPFAWASKPGTSLLLARRECHKRYHSLVWGIIGGRLVFLIIGVISAGMVGAAWAWVAVEIGTFAAVMVIMTKLDRDVRRTTRVVVVA